MLRERTWYQGTWRIQNTLASMRHAVLSRISGNNLWISFPVLVYTSTSIHTKHWMHTKCVFVNVCWYIAKLLCSHSHKPKWAEQIDVQWDMRPCTFIYLGLCIRLFHHILMVGYKVWNSFHKYQAIFYFPQNECSVNQAQIHFLKPNSKLIPSNPAIFGAAFGKDNNWRVAWR